MIRFKIKGDYKHTEELFKVIQSKSGLNILKKYGEMGVKALASATPVRTGETAASWGYEIVQDDNGYIIYWTNSHINRGVNIAILIQYGHATGTGGYVQGIDYINPALQPLFEEMADEAWREVTSA